MSIQKPFVGRTALYRDAYTGIATSSGSCRHRSTIPGATAALFALLAEPAQSAPMAISDFNRLALDCGHSVSPVTLASIAKIESGFDPLAINDNDTKTSSAPGTHESAVALASKLLAAGHSIDLGIMQINSGNLQTLGLTIEAAFDPCQSVAAAAAVLAGNYVASETHAEQQSALRVALSRYNTGDSQRGFDNGYVHKVELAARYVVPALDIAGQSTETDRVLPRHPETSAPADRNAPPPWDVWASFDYAAAISGKGQVHPGPTSEAN